MTLYGGIEAGGTKFVCAVGTGPGDIRDEIRFPTGAPEATLARAVDFFRMHAARTPLAAVGVASFGPIDPNPASPRYGQVLATVKPGWSHTDVVARLQDALRVPIGFDTDVNGAALAEYRWGAGRGCATFVYITVGTGVGGGAVINGARHHGLTHPEMGHMRIPHDRVADPYPGICVFHGDCWEGLACGPAMQARWGVSARDLPPDHPAWTLEAHYLAQGVMNIVMLLAPDRIAMGGGVMEQTHLYPRVRRELIDLLGGYIQAPAILDDVDTFIVPPQLGNQAGVLGAIALAQDAAQP
ncbi:MAG: ROK family protein [Caldilineaceae bacterium]|nr:ROK family protein [Caldilineaceae bacterium]